jgi:hypothetical protein
MDEEDWIRRRGWVCAEGLCRCQKEEDGCGSCVARGMIHEFIDIMEMWP